MMMTTMTAYGSCVARVHTDCVTLVLACMLCYWQERYNHNNYYRVHLDFCVWQSLIVCVACVLLQQ